MLEKINVESSVAVYMQIENEIQFAIAAGRLKPGDRLPTVQELAERLGVNPNTVGRAYRDLDVLGYVTSRRGLGVFIQPGVEAKCREECRRRIIARLHEVMSEAKAAGMSLRDIREVADKSLASETSPYSATPDAVLALGKGKKR